MRRITRKKRGRPRTGRDPVVPVRLPKKMLKQIAKLSEALSLDRSKTVRWMLERALEDGIIAGLLSRGKGRGLAGLVAAFHLSQLKADRAAKHAASSSPANQAHAKIKALRAAEEAESRRAVIIDRIERKKAEVRSK